LASSSQIDWNKLLRKTKKGDQESQNELCEKIRVRLWASLQYTLKKEPRQVLEDILHDCLETFLGKLDLVDSNPHYYADRILRNKVGDLLRARKRPRRISLSGDRGHDSTGRQRMPDKDPDAADPESDFTRHLESTEFVEILLNAIKCLDPFCRAYFLARLEDIDTKEVRDLVDELDPGLRRSAFYVRVLRCRRKLRKILKSYLEEK
jgi:DNA-directed RNA polymerase specialized sigma24 family protein